MLSSQILQIIRSTCCYALMRVACPMRCIPVTWQWHSSAVFTRSVLAIHVGKFKSKQVSIGHSWLPQQASRDPEPQNLAVSPRRRRSASLQIECTVWFKSKILQWYLRYSTIIYPRAQGNLYRHEKIWEIWWKRDRLAPLPVLCILGPC